MDKKPIGFYNYTVILTYIGMLSGFLGISCVMNGKVYTALICLMVAGICDMFDGAIASTMKNRTADEKYFGIQIDSLSDLICFGVLPAVIVIKLCDNNEKAFAVAGLFVLAGLIRLAYYNVDEMNRQKVSTEAREYFCGLPITSSAIILPFIMLMCDRFSLRKNIASLITLAVVGILFITPLKIKKPKIIGKIAMALCGILEFVFLIIGFADV